MKPTIEEVKCPSDEQLTVIYNEANCIKPGKRPPISTKFIFDAMRKAYEVGRKEQRESDEEIAMNWPDDCVFDVAEAIRNNTGE